MINQVEIHPIQDAVVLRKSGSELLILAHHVAALKTRKTAKDFSDYFMNEALVNRPARKLYENWLRKEADLWRRVYQSVQSMEQSAEAGVKADATDAVETKASNEAKPAKKKDVESKAEPKKAAAAKTEKASEAKKPAAKAEPKKAAPKLEKKAVAAPKKTTATKTAAPVRKVAIRASKKG